MKNNSINIWKFGCIIVTIIAIILLVMVLKNHSGKKDTNDAKSKTSQSAQNTNDDLDNNIRIMLDEDLSKEGTIEGLENVRWNDARIRQVDNEMEVTIMLNNESEKEKIPSRNLTVELLDKDKKIVLTKDIKMNEISANYGYTSLEFTIDKIDPIIIYDIQIQAK